MIGRGRNREAFWLDVQQTVAQVRPKLGRTVVFVNGKGGTGKTSTTANGGAALASILADNGSPKRVLLMEFDVQANLKTDLGLKGKPGDDDGQSMLAAVMGQGPLTVIRDVRPQLDVVPAGRVLKRVVRLLAAAKEDERIGHWLEFARAVADIAPAYDYILLDCPPGDEELQKLAMVLARWVVIPTVFDKASRYGLELVGELFDEVQDVNDEVDVLGVLMFAFERREERLVKDKATGDVIGVREVGQRQRLRRVLTEDLERAEAGAPVFTSVIGASKVAGEVCREAGCVAYELADILASDEWPAIAKRLEPTLGGKVTMTLPTAEALAADYQNAAIEIASRIGELEKEAVPA